jgi:hypothetical protein
MVIIFRDWIHTQIVYVVLKKAWQISTNPVHMCTFSPKSTYYMYVTSSVPNCVVYMADVVLAFPNAFSIHLYTYCEV